MLKKVKITKVFRNIANKDGIAYTIKNGKDAGEAFTRIGIKTEQTGDDSYYNNARNDSPILALEEGQEVMLKLWEEDGWKNFKFPTKDEVTAYEQALADAADAQ